MRLFQIAAVARRTVSTELELYYTAVEIREIAAACQIKSYIQLAQGRAGNYWVYQNCGTF